MNRDVTLEKIGYMMNRLGDTEITAEDMEEMIVKVFVASFEYEYGFEADLIAALLKARTALIEFEADDEVETPELDAKQAEEWYLECQMKMYQQAGDSKEWAAENAYWPDSLPVNAAWDKDILKTLARKEVAHHLVVREQIRAEMEKRDVNANP
jgi:hypothetical protein